jgi:hypothetical protein
MSPHEDERLSAYLDGELGPGERAAVEAHLETCALCRSRLAELAGLDEAARARPLPEPPAGYFESFPARVRAALEAEGAVSARARGLRAGPPRWRWPAWSWAAAAALLLVVVTPLTLLEFRGGRRISPETGPPATARPEVRPETSSAAAPSAREKAAAEEPPIAPALAPVPPAREAPGREPASRKGAAGNERGRVAGGASRAAAPPPASYAPPAASAPAEATSRERPGVAPAPAPERPTLAAAGAPAAPAGPMAASRAERPAARDQALPKKGEDEESAYRRLAREEPTDAVGWRRLREAWRAFVREHPEGPDADEARVHTIEAGMAAWRMSGDEQDLERARADLAAYLSRPDARQTERARRALEAAAP